MIFIREGSEVQIQASRSLQDSQTLNWREKANLLPGRGSEVAINFHRSGGLEDSSADATANSNESVIGQKIAPPNNTNIDQRDDTARGLVSTMNDIEITETLSGSGPLPASSDYLNFILNPSAANFPPQTPESPGGVQSGCASEMDHYVSSPTLPLSEPRLETNPEVAFLLRHFSEGPGKWYD